MAKKSKKDYMERLRGLIDVGVALSSEKEINRLLEVILEKALQVTQCEGASIYMVENKAIHQSHNVVSLQKEAVLRFLKSINRREGHFDKAGMILAIDTKSIAGYVAKTKEILNLPDCYKLDSQAPYSFNDNYDKSMGYRSKSMLTIPMITADGQVRGVLQLINKLSDRGLEKLAESNKLPKQSIVSFSDEDVELMRVFASYAAIAVENSQLTESIENLFESFVRASVKAIEARDPTTSGHSDRVAMMTVELALATHKIGEGYYKNVEFSEDQLKEIRYASLLHDFGKIGVKEKVLLKKKKLEDRGLESILMRFDTLGYSEETRIWKDFGERLMDFQKKKNSGHFDPDQAFRNAEKQIQMLKYRINKMRSQVITANEPQVMSEDFNIDELIAKVVRANQFFNNSVLSQDELKTLSIPRGSLNPEERDEIESHVSHTYEFLKQIAWTENLSHVTAIAHCHHEKMDGTGYPQRIKGEAIPIQSRMMTIADIYDALTAFDRPYKKSLPASRALEILIKDARAGKIDGHLLKIFIEAGIFHHATLGTHKKAS